MWIAPLAYSDNSGTTEIVTRCGELWQGNGGAFIRLRILPLIATEVGVRMFGVAFSDVEAPFLEGVLTTHGYASAEEKIGEVWTVDNPVGRVCYMFRLTGVPMVKSDNLIINIREI